MGEAWTVKLRYTIPASLELDEVLEYIYARSPKGAVKVQARIQGLTELLRTNPQLGGATSDPDIRRVVVTPYPYIILYQPTENEIIIHSIRHGSRGPLHN